MSIVMYCGIQEFDDWFMPLYNDNQGSTHAPQTKHELYELARYDSLFIHDFRHEVSKNKSLICNDYFSSQQTKQVLLESTLCMIEHHAQLVFFNQIRSQDNYELFKVLQTVSDELDVGSFLKRYQATATRNLIQYDAFFDSL